MADLTRDEIEHLRGNWPPDSMASRLCDMALRSEAQPVAWMLRGDVEQQTTVFFSYGQATYALEARTKSGWNQHIVPLYTSRQPAQSNVPVFGPNGNVSIMFSATKEQEEEHQRVIEASKAAFGLSTPAPQQGQTDAFSTLQAIRPFFADRLADGIDSTGERQTYELMLGIIDRASPPPAQQPTEEEVETAEHCLNPNVSYPEPIEGEAQVRDHQVKALARAVLRWAGKS